MQPSQPSSPLPSFPQPEFQEPPAPEPSYNTEPTLPPGLSYPPMGPPPNRKRKDLLLIAGALVVALPLAIYFMVGAFSVPNSKSADTKKSSNTASGTTAKPNTPTSTSNTPAPSTGTQSTPADPLQQAYVRRTERIKLGKDNVDYKRMYLMDYDIKFRMLAITTVTGHAPANAAEYYAYFPAHNVPYKSAIDPGTNQEIHFVDTTPNINEIQIAAQQYCSNDLVNLGRKVTTRANVYALRILLSDGLPYCTSNLKDTGS